MDNLLFQPRDGIILVSKKLTERSVSEAFAVIHDQGELIVMARSDSMEIAIYDLIQLCRACHSSGKARIEFVRMFTREPCYLAVVGKTELGSVSAGGLILFPRSLRLVLNYADLEAIIEQHKKC